MQDVHIKNSIPLDVANTLGFAIDLRYPNLAKPNQWEENQAHFMQLYSIMSWTSSSWNDQEEVCLIKEHTTLVLKVD